MGTRKKNEEPATLAFPTPKPQKRMPLLHLHLFRALSAIDRDLPVEFRTINSDKSSLIRRMTRIESTQKGYWDVRSLMTEIMDRDRRESLFTLRLFFDALFALVYAVEVHGEGDLRVACLVCTVDKIPVGHIKDLDAVITRRFCANNLAFYKEFPATPPEVVTERMQLYAESGCDEEPEPDAPAEERYVPVFV